MKLCIECVYHKKGVCRNASMGSISRVDGKLKDNYCVVARTSIGACGKEARGFQPMFQAELDLQKSETTKKPWYKRLLG